MRTSAPRPRGFTLLEALIALVVFSIGLLGLAGLMTVAVKTNHSAYLRTQATFIAESMADRMRANTMGVWKNSYNGTGYPITGTDPCASGTACGYLNMATHDQLAFSTQLSDLLPNAAATIKCTPIAGAVTPNVLANPPYNGLCSMRITWDEARLDKDSSDTTGRTSQTFAWVFRP